MSEKLENDEPKNESETGEQTQEKKTAPVPKLPVDPKEIGSGLTNMTEKIPGMMKNATSVPKKLLDGASGALKIGQDMIGSLFGGSGIKSLNIFNKIKFIDEIPFFVENPITDTMPYPEDGFVHPSVLDWASVSVCGNYFKGGRNPQTCEAYGEVLNKEIDPDLICRWGRKGVDFGYPTQEQIDEGFELVDSIIGKTPKKVKNNQGGVSVQRSRSALDDYSEAIGQIAGGPVTEGFIEMGQPFLITTRNLAEDISDFVVENDACWAYTLPDEKDIDDIYT